MMLKRISCMVYILFFLLGTSVYAQTPLHVTNIEHSTAKSSAAIEKTTKVGTMSTANSQTKKHSSYKIYLLPGIVSFLLIISLGSYWFFFRKKSV